MNLWLQVACGPACYMAGPFTLDLLGDLLGNELVAPLIQDWMRARLQDTMVAAGLEGPPLRLGDTTWTVIAVPSDGGGPLDPPPSVPD